MAVVCSEDFRMLRDRALRQGLRNLDFLKLMVNCIISKHDLVAFTAREFNYVDLSVILQYSLKLSLNLTENALSLHYIDQSVNMF
jgi:hypothetical protein